MRNTQVLMFEPVLNEKHTGFDVEPLLMRNTQVLMFEPVLNEKHTGFDV